MLRAVQGSRHRTPRPPHVPDTSSPPIRGDRPSAARRRRPAASAVELTAEAGAPAPHLARAAVDGPASGRPCRDRPSVLLPDPPGPACADGGLRHAARGRRVARLHRGTLATDRPLWETVVSAAVGAAAGDPRFLPVTEAEVPTLSIDVSVLGDPRPPSGIRGIPARDRRRSSSSVAVDAACSSPRWRPIRAGAPARCSPRRAGRPDSRDAWRDPRTTVLVFRTARVSETETSDRYRSG